MKRKLSAGLTSASLPIFIQDTSSTTGGGLASVVYNSSGIVAEYRRQGQSTWTPITLAPNTLGTYVAGGFIADGALTGAYELCVPDAALAAGARWVAIRIRGVTNMFPVLIEIELDVVNYQSANNFMTGLNAQTYPAFVPGASGGLATIDASLRVSANVTAIGGTATTYDANNLLNVNVKDWNGTATTLLPLTDKAGYSLSGSQTFNVTGNITGNLSGSVGSVTGAVGSIASGGITSASFAAGSLAAAAFAAGALTGKGDWLPATLMTVKTPTALNKIYFNALNGTTSYFAEGQDVVIAFVSGTANWYSATGIVHQTIDANGSWIDLNHNLYLSPSAGDTFYCLALNPVPLTSAGVATATQTGMTAQGYTTTRGPFLDYIGNMTTGTGTSRLYTALALSNGPSGGSSGAFSLTITVTDGTNPISNANVRFGNAIVATNGSGVATFSRDAGTYTLSITYGGYSYTPTTQVIDSSGHFTNATAALTAVMTVVTIPTPTAANTVTGYLTAYDDTLVAQAGVRFRFHLSTGDGVAARSVKSEYFYATSDSNGLVTTTFLQNATYIGERQTSRSGNYGTGVTITVGTTTPLAIPQVLGTPV